MFIHNLKYSLKILFRNKMLIFWTFAFPIILGTFFNMAFSNITENEKLDIIDIAIVENEELEENKVWKKVFNELSDKENKNRLFNIKYTSKEEAKKLLNDDKISGYMILKENIPQITVVKNGIEQTIFKYTTEKIWQSSEIAEKITENEIQKEIQNGNFNINYDEIYKSVAQILENSDVKINDKSDKNLDYVMIEFYTLIAMTALYGGMLSMFSINQSMPNLSNKGKRIAVSKTKKSTIIFSSLLASYMIQLIGMVIVFLYTIFVLNINYGQNLGLIILLALIGSLAGLSLGLFIGAVLKTNENNKMGILVAFTMLGCYFSGMMGITMKYIIDKNIPIINKLNPASMITDGFYSLYYYNTLNRYWFDLISIIIFSVVLVTISVFSLRRQKYDSI